jgi:hypothetical protein
MGRHSLRTFVRSMKMRCRYRQHGWLVDHRAAQDVEPLTNPRPTAKRRGCVLVIPSMPGYGFSASRPPRLGLEALRGQMPPWAPGIRALRRAGGDWGALIVDMMGVQAPKGLIGIHTNMAGAIPPRSMRRPLPGSAASRPRRRREIPSTTSFFLWSRLCAGDGGRPQTLYGLRILGRPGRVDHRS